MEIITRANAQLVGLKRYFTGEPCKRGHVAERSVCDGKCVACEAGRVRKGRTESEYMRRWRAEHKPQINETRRAYYATHREQFKAKNAQSYAKHRAERRAQQAAYRIRREERLHESQQTQDADHRHDDSAK